MRRGCWAIVWTLIPPAVLLASCGTSTDPNAQRFAAIQPQTTAVPTTSTMLPATTTSDTTAVPSTTTTSAVTTTMATTTTAPVKVPPSTTTTLPPQCQGAQFDSAISTTAIYATGTAIPIDLELTNVGPTCESEPSIANADVLDGCPYVTIVDSSGQTVWDESIDENTKSQTGCITLGVAGAVPTGWSRHFRFTWTQDQCPGPGLQCTQAQEPAGVYTIRFAQMGGVWNGIAVNSTSVTIS